LERNPYAAYPSVLRPAGRHDEAELALRDLVAEHGLTGRAANLLALVCGEQGNTKDELHYAEKAATLKPLAPAEISPQGEINRASITCASILIMGL
jgi:hypothetical protein